MIIVFVKVYAPVVMLFFTGIARGIGHARLEPSRERVNRTCETGAVARAVEAASNNPHLIHQKRGAFIFANAWP